MDLSPLLYVPDTGSARRNVLPRNEVITHAGNDETVGDRIVEQVLASLRANPEAPVRLAHPVRNIERTVSARLSGQLALRYGDQGLPDDQVRISFTGSLARVPFPVAWSPPIWQTGTVRGVTTRPA